MNLDFKFQFHISNLSNAPLVWRLRFGEKRREKEENAKFNLKYFLFGSLSGKKRKESGRKWRDRLVEKLSSRIWEEKFHLTF